MKLRGKKGKTGQKAGKKGNRGKIGEEGGLGRKDEHREMLGTEGRERRETWYPFLQHPARDQPSFSLQGMAQKGLRVAILI